MKDPTLPCRAFSKVEITFFRENACIFKWKVSGQYYTIYPPIRVYSISLVIKVSQGFFRDPVESNRQKTPIRSRDVDRVKAPPCPRPSLLYNKILRY